jgi:hypothetical protein
MSSDAMTRMRLRIGGLLLTALASSVGCYSGLSGVDPRGDGDGDGGADGDDAEEPPPIADQCEGGELDPGPNLVRRLTVAEYAATVRTVTGADIEAQAREVLPPDPRADGFSNTASGLITTLAHVEGYDALAEQIVAAMDLAAFTAQHTSCTDFTEACEREALESLSLAFHRAPLRPEEAEQLRPIFAVVQDEGEGFEVAVGLVLETMLQSPRFLFRMEDERGDGSIRELDGFEMATRLGYLVWGGPPDDALLAAAAAGSLRSDDDVEAQVRRMLADPRVRDASRRFAHDWLNLARLDGLVRDPDRFPQWDPSLGVAMQAETHAFFETVLWSEQRPIAELFNAQLTIVQPQLAAHYGLTAGPDGRVDLSGVPERGGLLTQGALLTVGGNESSMVARGLFVLETLMCGHLASPPPGIDTTPPTTEPGSSQRTYSEERVENPSCGGCHAQMEPFAWGIERFRADGTHALEDEYGNALREDGFVRMPGSSGDVSYSTVGELMDLLAGSEAVQECFNRRSLQFAIGRSVVPTDRCTMDAIRARFAESAGTYEDLLVAIALSPGFRTITTEP